MQLDKFYIPLKDRRKEELNMLKPCESKKRGRGYETDYYPGTFRFGPKNPNNYLILPYFHILKLRNVQISTNYKFNKQNSFMDLV